jgi:hypothetical protein
MYFSLFIKKEREEREGELGVERERVCERDREGEREGTLERDDDDLVDGEIETESFIEREVNSFLAKVDRDRGERETISSLLVVNRLALSLGTEK